LLLHRADRARGENRLHAEELEAEDVRAVVDLRRHHHVAAAVAREESHADAADLADHVRCRRRAERRVERALLHDAQSLHLIEAGAANDADVHFRYAFTDVSIAAATSLASFTAARPSSPETSGRERCAAQARELSSSARSGSFFSMLMSIGSMERPFRR